RQGPSGKHDSPAKRVVRSIAFIDGDLVGRVRLFHEDGEVHSGRTTADDFNLHAECSSSALPKRSTPISNNSGSAHMPRRRCCGISKKRPGTKAVSYLSLRRVQRSSTSPFSSRGKQVVPASGTMPVSSSRVSRKSRSTA